MHHSDVYFLASLCHYIKLVRFYCVDLLMKIMSIFTIYKLFYYTLVKD